METILLILKVLVILGCAAGGISAGYILLMVLTQDWSK